MQKKMLSITIAAMFFLTGCAMFPPHSCNNEQLKITQLEKDIQESKIKNQQLQNDNQELAVTGKQTLDRLSEMQKRYAIMSEETKNLSQQNQELHEQLYQERLQKHEKWRQENDKAKKIFDAYSPEWELENAKAQKLFEKQLSQPETSASVEQTPKMETDMDSIELNASGQLLLRLEEKRIQLIDRKNWGMPDEKKFTDVIENLALKNASESMKKKYISEAIELEKKMDDRLSRK